jgi:hypothetical protein
MALVSFRPSPR